MKISKSASRARPHAGGLWRASSCGALTLVLMRLKDAQVSAAAGSVRGETVMDAGLWYAPGDPVCVRAVRREQRLSVADDGAAIEKAGRPARWRDVADQVERALIVNVSRRGVVWLPVVAAGPSFDAVVQRIAEASLDFYQSLLELHD
jgi:hypothetical protein